MTAQLINTVTKFQLLQQHVIGLRIAVHVSNGRGAPLRFFSGPTFQTVYISGLYRSEGAYRDATRRRRFSRVDRQYRLALGSLQIITWHMYAR